jgi:hypothetical protein
MSAILSLVVRATDQAAIRVCVVRIRGLISRRCGNSCLPAITIRAASMSCGAEKAKRRNWRPRFTVRTLAIVVSLVCAYFGAWEVTKRNGVPAVSSEVNSESTLVRSSRAPGPFLVLVDVHRRGKKTNTSQGYIIQFDQVRLYHLWLLGPTVKLPFETTWK